MARMDETAGIGSSRRRVLAQGGFAGLAAAALATGFAPQKALAQTADLDVYVLNFALNLEYLEAEFYNIAATGQGLTDAQSSGIGTVGAVTGGNKLSFTTPRIGQFIAEVANDELNHVKFLRSALGSSAYARPAIDFAKSFSALGALIGFPSFNPFHDELSFLLGAYVFEDVGVTAYSGAAPLITDKGYLGAAAGILAVEAYHAGAIRTLLAEFGGGTLTDAISAVRAQVSGAADDQGTLVNGKINIVPADSNSIAFARTPTQVLDVVYLGSASKPGGFFPNGVNLPPS